MHPEDMFPPELMNDLITFVIGIIIIATLVIVGVLSKRAREDRRRQEDHGDCLKTEVPEGEEQAVCLKDQYAQSMVSPYLDKPEEDCPECPPCYCSTHGMNCPDIFRRLRELADDFTLETTLHEGSRFEYGQAAAFTNAAARLTALLDELEGKDQNSG